MHFKILVFTGLIIVFFLPPGQSKGQIVRITDGLISGVTNEPGDVMIFKSIPYATPPLGELRWKEPQPVKPWNGIRKCEDFGPNAMQTKPTPADPYSAEILIPATGKISEDCLYLNIWTPVKQQNKKRPVIVVIHGGSFTSGSGSVSLLNGEQMAKKGAVVVTINYRLGIFGFLAHPALTAESPHHSSGNYGILDQIVAFQWVKDNIAAFGGDPNNITANGGSAGSCSMVTIIASPLGKDLFKRAISESGPLFQPNECRVLQQAEKEGVETMTKKGAQSLSDMRLLPADVLLKDDHLRLPVVDGYLLPDQILNIFMEGKQNGVDLLIGYNEGDEDYGSPVLSAAAFVTNAKKKYGDKAKAFLTLYPAQTNEEATRSQRLLSRDRVFGWGNYNWARYQASKGKYKVWFYYFNRTDPGNSAYGAFHGCQGAYAMHNLNRWNKTYPKWDHSLSDIMSNYWINFASSGNPNNKGLPIWPRFRMKNTIVIQFGDQIKTIDLPAMRSFEFF